MLQFGVCTTLPHAKDAVAAGFDYVELPAQLFKGTETLCDLNPLKGLPLPVVNLFFPGNVRLFTEEGRAFWPDYSRRVMERAASVGVKTIVLSNGHSRTAPEHMNLDQAEDEFAKLCGDLQKLARKFHLTLAPSNVSHTESNVGNDLAALMKRLEKHHVHACADAYHLLEEWDEEGREHDKKAPSESYWKQQIPSLPVHVHMASFPARTAPKAEDPFLKGFVKRLTTLGYKGRVSLECKFITPAMEMPQALRDIRALFHAED